MGKDRELLEAAQTGNIGTVEKLLRNKSNSSKFLSGLRRHSGINVQDSTGYSALHYASLNGHRNIVTLLLGRQVCADITDSQGSTPLHLAAWAGHQEIVELLLRAANDGTINIKNKDGETALHCASQYGHSRIVSVLLSFGADPAVRNIKHQTPLDLAALYGRLETVKILVNTHPELIELYRRPETFQSSPLHSASRNGHGDIVEVLLQAGFPVSLRTPTGTALHEAAIGGKVGVVRRLLQEGIDVLCKDNRDQTALQIMDGLETSVAKEITALIRERIQSLNQAPQVERIPSSILI